MTPIPTELRELLERATISCDVYDPDQSAAIEELRALLATPPADAADMGGQAGEEIGKPDFYLDGGSQACYYAETVQHTLAQHRQQAGKLAEALRRGLLSGRGTSGRIIIDAEGEEVMREALADWEKTSCGK